MANPSVTHKSRSRTAQKVEPINLLEDNFHFPPMETVSRDHSHPPPCYHWQHTQLPSWHSHPPPVCGDSSRYIPTRSRFLRHIRPVARTVAMSSHRLPPRATDPLNLSGRFPAKEEAATGIAHHSILDHSRPLYSAFPASSRPVFALRAPFIRGELNERLLSATLSGEDWEWSTPLSPRFLRNCPPGATPRPEEVATGLTIH
jgi:hypothetical protein